MLIRTLEPQEIETVIGGTLDVGSPDQPVDTGTGPTFPTDPVSPGLPPVRGQH